MGTKYKAFATYGLLGVNLHESPSPRAAALASGPKAVAACWGDCLLPRAGSVEYGEISFARSAHQPEMVAYSGTRRDEPLGLDLGIFREHDRLARSPIQSLTRRPFSTCGKCTRGAGNRAHAPGNNGTLSSARHQASQELKKRARRLRFRVLWLCRLSPSPRDMF